MSLPKRIGMYILFLTLIVNGTAYAKGPPDIITIIGPGLPDEIEIKDSEILNSFAMGQFIDFQAPIQEPLSSLDGGYEITRWYRIALDRFVYYPNPQGDNGYVFYEGIIDKMFIYGGSPNDGKWFIVTDSGELAILQVLKANDISWKGQDFLLTGPDESWKWDGRGSLLVTSSMILAFTMIFITYRLHKRSAQTLKYKPHPIDIGCR